MRKSVINSKYWICKQQDVYCRHLIHAGHEPGFCMMCTMQNHIIQVFANSGNVIKPIGVLHELKSKYSQQMLLYFINLFQHFVNMDVLKLRVNFQTDDASIFK